MGSTFHQGLWKDCSPSGCVNIKPDGGKANTGIFIQVLTQACSSNDSGCNREMEIMDLQNSSKPVRLILW